MKIYRYSRGIEIDFLRDMAYKTCHKIVKHWFRFTLQLNYIPQGLRVTGISKDKPARQRGLQFDDVIQLCAMVAVKTVGGLYSCLETSGLRNLSLMLPQMAGHSSWQSGDNFNINTLYKSRLDFYFNVSLTTFIMHRRRHSTEHTSYNQKPLPRSFM